MSHTISAESPPPRFVADALLVALVCLLFAGIFGSTILETAQIALTNDDYSHGTLLPAVVAFLLWDKRRILKQARLAMTQTFVWTIVLALGLGIFLVGFSSDLHFPMWIALFPSLLGAVGLLWGGGVARHCILPLTILYMAKPLPDVLMPKLFGRFQNLAAHTSAWALEHSGIPTFISGNVIEIPGMKLLVEEACSGMRSIITILTVALIIIAVSKHSKLTQAVLVLLSLLLALLLNVVRVTVTGFLAYGIGPGAAHGFMHTFSGLATFLLGFLLLYLISRWLETRNRGGNKLTTAGAR